MKNTEKKILAFTQFDIDEEKQLFIKGMGPINPSEFWPMAKFGYPVK
ncbi:MAG: hypothetical protein AAFQ94_23965 [Bacteroidota bacterium]